MAAITTGQQAATSGAEDFYRAVREHNDQARLLAREGRCGGCIGAGHGPRCLICGGQR